MTHMTLTKWTNFSTALTFDFGQVVPTVMPHGKVWWVTGGRLLIGAWAFGFSLTAGAETCFVLFQVSSF